MSPLNFLKQFKSKRHSPEMLNSINHVILFCENVKDRIIYMTEDDEWDHRLLWAFAQSLNYYDCRYPVGKSHILLSTYESWIQKYDGFEQVILNELGARMLSYLHNSLYDIRYYRKLFAEFSYYRYINGLKEPIKKPL